MNIGSHYRYFSGALVHLRGLLKKKCAWTLLEDGCNQLRPKLHYLPTYTASYHRSFYLRVCIFIYGAEMNILDGIKREQALRV
jgi:hypothetical protein